MLYFYLFRNQAKILDILFVLVLSIYSFTYLKLDTCCIKKKHLVEQQLFQTNSCQFYKHIIILSDIRLPAATSIIFRFASSFLNWFHSIMP